MKLALITTLLIISLLTLIPIGLTFGIKYLPGGVQPSLGNTQKIYKDIEVSEDFISPKDNLSGIGTSIKNPNFANKENLTLNLYDDRGELLRSITVNGKNIADGKFVKLFFDPINYSEDKKFTLTFSSPASSYEDSLELFLANEKPSWNLQYRVKSEVIDKELSFVTLHNLSSSTQVLSLVWGNFVKKFFEDRYFAIFYLFLLSAISLAFIWQTKSQRKN